MRETGAAVRQETWAAWPVFWSAVWVGAFASVVAVILFGLAGTAFGAYAARTSGGSGCCQSGGGRRCCRGDCAAHRAHGRRRRWMDGVWRAHDHHQLPNSLAVLAYRRERADHADLRRNRDDPDPALAARRAARADHPSLPSRRRALAFFGRGPRGPRTRSGAR